MSRISVLPPHVVNLIAAGEVVERPASVLKELLENSIDAGSTHIKVYVEEHGSKLIEVIDNGSGIEKDDAPLVFEQHATSKINRSSDLQKISSFGFRGEAIASIRSVAEKIHLQSMTDKSDAFAYIATPTTLTQDSPHGSNHGTRIQIYNLFATVPARKKFLKSPTTELKHITETLIQSALTHPNIHFELYHNDKQIKNFPNSTLEARVADVMGSDFIKHSYETEAVEHPPYKLKAFLGNTNLGKKSSANQYLFVNNRFVTNKSIYSAIAKAYQGFLHRDLKPSYIMFFEAAPDVIDVNVHPRKLEVRFNEPSEVFKFVFYKTKTILNNKAKEELTNDFTEPQVDNNSKPINTNKHSVPHVSRNRTSSPTSQYIPKSKEARVQQAMNFTQVLLENEGLESDILGSVTSSGSEHVESIFIDSNPKQLFNTYILIEKDDSLIVVDQHAAAEKIAFEKLMKQYNKPQSKPLLVPSIVELDQAQKEVMMNKQETLSSLGLTIEPFGQNSIQVTEVPELTSELDAQEYIERVLAETDEFESSYEGYASQTTHPISEEEYYIIATTACHGSIRAGQQLKEVEMIQIVKDLFSLKNPRNCPHGRPTYYKLDKYEIEKFFNRAV